MSKIEVPLGSVSHGTLRDWDLLDAFHDALLGIHHQLWFDSPDRHTDLIVECRALLDMGEEKFEKNVYDGTIDPFEILDRLSNELNEYSPPGYYFGSHIGDGADFGWWPCQGTDCEDEDENEAHDIEDFTRK